MRTRIFLAPLCIAAKSVASREHCACYTENAQRLASSQWGPTPTHVTQILEGSGTGDLILLLSPTSGMGSLRHEFYETEEKLTLSVFDRGADPNAVSVKFEPRQLLYRNGDKVLSLQPLKGQIDPTRSDYAIGKVKVEIRLAKMVLGRWGSLIGDAPDPLASFVAPPPSQIPISHKRKNWEDITTDILASETERSVEQDPNVGGDSTVNTFFQKIFADADDDTRRAMMKSFQESGGTTLSTNWEEVKKDKVEVKPPEGSEWRKWG